MTCESRNAFSARLEERRALKKWEETCTLIAVTIEENRKDNITHPTFSIFSIYENQDNSRQNEISEGMREKDINRVMPMQCLYSIDWREKRDQGCNESIAE